jgi:hypothetical protein
MPAAIRIRAGQILVSEHLHRFDFRERGIRAPLLHVDIMTALGAFKYDSIGYEDAFVALVKPLDLSEGAASPHLQPFFLAGGSGKSNK